MQKEKIVPIIKGLIKHIPGVRKMLAGGTGGTTQSRYCYAIWMRHLKNWSEVHSKLPEVVLELGPGDSLGVGLAALLTGSNRMYALDVVKYWDDKRNIQVFDELLELFKQRADIPGASEYPKVKPILTDHRFPSSILTETILTHSLADSRINAIRKELADVNNPANTFIKCYAPWNQDVNIPESAIDFIYSQAVLEYVGDLDGTFALMNRWLKPNGLISHTIDFKSHGLTPTWNGHWTLGELEWKIVKGGQKFLLNREPYSTYIELQEKHGFSIVMNVPFKLINTLQAKNMAKRFRDLSEEDKATGGAYFLSRKV
jgi:Methyltransferase domain